MTALSGFSVCKNALSLDYPVELMVKSLLPICDEVVIGEMGSTDGTYEMLADMAFLEPKIRVVRIRDWTLEKGKMDWFVNALNETRGHLKFPMALELDSDEYLSDDPQTHAAIRQCVHDRGAIAMDRINFVRDAHSVIPEGECCGRWVTRLGPSDLWFPSDEPHQRGEVPLLDMAKIEPKAVIYHLGFLRKREAFFAKARVVLGAFFNEFDTRLAEAEAQGYHAFEKFPWWNRLTRFDGYYPASVKEWMEARGYKL